MSLTFFWFPKCNSRHGICLHYCNWLNICATNDPNCKWLLSSLNVIVTWMVAFDLYFGPYCFMDCSGNQLLRPEWAVSSYKRSGYIDFFWYIMWYFVYLFICIWFMYLYLCITDFLFIYIIIYLFICVYIRRVHIYLFTLIIQLLIYIYIYTKEPLIDQTWTLINQWFGIALPIRSARLVTGIPIGLGNMGNLQCRNPW